eukprot:TRINITY_DN702_c0_g1_i1.p1 TRINITY_DN702_c0_g1~~TRINITY_DN702_c0_g1_i1.p1  ORF type:complete len:406 (-),score=105.45 TRINITY_DN702_c0_g1_i1:73-1290(-)
MAEQPKPVPKGSATVRASKYRHLFATPAQNTDSILGVKLGSSQAEASVIKANAKWFAVPWGINGTVAVLPVNSKGAVNADSPLLVHEENTVNDFAFNPFDDQLLATACQDGTLQLWKIPEEGLTDNQTNPAQKIQVGDKRVLMVDFHPRASNIAVTADAGKAVKLWDIQSGSEKFALPDVFKGLISNVSWNADGSLLAVSCKDKRLRIFDPRSGNVTAEGEDHQGAKGGKVIWLGKKDLIFTVGASKLNERQYGLFDPRDLTKRLTIQNIDSSSSSLLPFYDNDLGIMYLGGKGDGNIRYYEISDEAPFVFYLNEFKSKDPQTGLVALPKSSCDVMKCEVMRMLKITPNGNVVPLKFEVPRKENVFFQDDLYPDTYDGQPSMTADEWVGGASTPGNTRSLKPEGQ